MALYGARGLAEDAGDLPVGEPLHLEPDTRYSSGGKQPGQVFPEGHLFVERWGWVRDLGVRGFWVFGVAGGGLGGEPHHLPAGSSEVVGGAFAARAVAVESLLTVRRHSRKPLWGPEPARRCSSTGAEAVLDGVEPGDHLEPELPSPLAVRSKQDLLW